jgi:Zn-dependent protease/predicted transcriptional regulator
VLLEREITDAKRAGGRHARVMPGRSFKLARIAGIPVGISPWWLVIVALITWSLGAGYYPVEAKGIAPLASYGLGLASVLLLFASILAHEFGHALVARRRGVEIEEIDLWLLGGVSRMKGQPKTPGDELAFALAGPAVTAVIAAVFGAVWLLLPSSAPSWLRALIVYETEVNGLILAFNLIPAFPLDGGRVARALLWRRSGDISRATESAAGLGRVFGYLMIAFGLVLTFEGALGGLWIALIGMFVVAAANAERLQQEVLTEFTGVLARDLMSHPAVSISEDATLVQAQDQFARYRYTAFPVIDRDGRAVGVLSIKQLERTPRSRWRLETTGELAVRDKALLVGEQEDVAHLLEEPAFAHVGRAAVIDRAGRPVGVVSITDVQRSIRARHLGDRTRPPDGLTAHA